MKAERGGWRPLRREELRDELVHDAYQSKKKLPEATRCPECTAVYHHGRWTWETARAGAHEETCPACQRIRDKLPAGYVKLTGEFFLAHRHEILRLARHLEAQEKTEHPLQRIMASETIADGVLITTTDTHLARGIGEAIHGAYKGELSYHYNKEENLLRVQWAR